MIGRSKAFNPIAAGRKVRPDKKERESPWSRLTREKKRKDAPFRAFNHNSEKKETCAGCLPNAAAWARKHPEVIKRTTTSKGQKYEK